MFIRTRFIICAATILLIALVSRLRAAEQHVLPAVDQEIAPYIDDLTIFVLRGDLEDLNVNAIQGWGLRMMQRSGMPPQEVAQMMQELPQQMAKAQKWLDDFKKAGGRRVYVIARLADEMDNGVMVVPLDKNGDEKAIMKQMKSLGMFGQYTGFDVPVTEPAPPPVEEPKPASKPGAIQFEFGAADPAAGAAPDAQAPAAQAADAKAADAQAPAEAHAQPATQPATQPGEVDFSDFSTGHGERIGDAVVFGTNKTLARLRRIKPQPRPDLKIAFDSVGNPALTLGFVMSPAARKKMDELVKNNANQFMPFPPGWLDQFMKIQWAAIGLKPPPQPDLHVMLKDSDADSAKELRNLIEKAVANPQIPAPIAQTLHRLIPKQDGEKLVLDLSTQEFEQTIIDISKLMVMGEPRVAPAPAPVPATQEADKPAPAADKAK